MHPYLIVQPVVGHVLVDEDLPVAVVSLARSFRSRLLVGFPAVSNSQRRQPIAGSGGSETVREGWEVDVVLVILLREVEDVVPRCTRALPCW